jgi:hypothetical protein
MDAAISVVFGKTCGMNLTPFQGVWQDMDGKDHNLAHSADFFSCVDLTQVDAGNPWGCHVVLSLGYIIVAAMAIPCGRWNLDDNMMIQTVAFVITVGFWIVWIVASMSQIASMDEMPSLPAINNSPGVGSQAGWLGNILFNFGFVTTVPSWVNEKRPQVSANKTLWVSTTMCIMVFFLVGITGALAYADVLQGLVTGTCARNLADPSFNCPNDLMQALTQRLTEPASWRAHGWSNVLLSVSVYLFPIAAVVSSIPVFSIVIKYNLLENGFSKTSGFMWAVVFPWIVGFPLLYMPDALGQFINFTSLFFVTFTDFIVPLMLYITLQKQRQDGSTESEDRSVLGQSLVDEGVNAHYAFPKRWGLSPTFKSAMAGIIAVILGVSAIVAAVLTIMQGSYEFDLQTCALVGS